MTWRSVSFELMFDTILELRFIDFRYLFSRCPVINLIHPFILMKHSGLIRRRYHAHNDNTICIAMMAFCSLGLQQYTQRGGESQLQETHL